jgi:beta-galactosidase
MGKQLYYVNGRLVRQNFGGYLPVTINLTQAGVKAGEECLVAVKADNGDDPNYPPGKKQAQLDFAYHGGMYRDVWLMGLSPIHITDPLERNQVAGGGIFLHYGDITKESAEVFINVEIANERPQKAAPTVVATIKTADGRPVKTLRQKVPANGNDFGSVVLKTRLQRPHLWSPQDPYLYKVEITVDDGRRHLDGGILRMGIRKAEFRGTDGFWLNGEPSPQLIGGNRHQDFAYVGNALPNSQQWRDAKRLRDAGFTIIRTAHYPQAPSFMDACDEMGLFIIVATPGWQYWNKEKGWDEKVHENTRNIIRRDRNHPCVLMWEPILNETRYPEDFALKALQITKDEYPYPYRPVAAADVHSAGVAEHYDVVYGWPGDDFASDDLPIGDPKKIKQCIFTREFGELVDDWYAHNNLNRASRSWGERPMLVQALSLYRSTQELFHTTGQFIGGCQWHPFDHQRGYHPDPYWGGIYDAFRQKKTAFDMFAAMLQQPTEQPMVTIAHEMTQFSEKDVTVFSNCDSVCLTMYDGEHCWTQPVDKGLVVFKDAWDFFEARNWSYTQKNWQSVKMVAEGFVDGKVVCKTEKMPSRRSTKLRLYVDEMGKKLVADGSDFVVVVCEVTDDLGHVRRLAKENIRFTVEGEGEIIGDASINANPRAVEWGSAPVLIRSTKQAGKIKIKAEVQFPGIHAPTSAELEIESIPYNLPMCYQESNLSRTSRDSRQSRESSSSTLSDAEKNKLLQEVEAQQADFGIQK